MKFILLVLIGYLSFYSYSKSASVNSDAAKPESMQSQTPQLASSLVGGETSDAKARVGCDELRSEQVRLELMASNLANLNTTRTPEGGPYSPIRIKSAETENIGTESYLRL